MLDFLALSSSSTHPQLISIVYSIALSFILSVFIALIYRHTFQGLSFSRNFLQTLILASVVSCIALQAIGDNLARGLGMMGALSMIRFRASLREPKDLIFVFASLSIGVAAGVHSYSLATAGALGFGIVAFVLYKAPFSSDTFYDALLRFNIENRADVSAATEKILGEYCKTFALVTLRESAQGDRLDYAYQVKMNTGKNHGDFVNAIRHLPGARGVQMLMQEGTIEV